MSKRHNLGWHILVPFRDDVLYECVLMLKLRGLYSLWVLFYFNLSNNTFLKMKTHWGKVNLKCERNFGLEVHSISSSNKSPSSSEFIFNFSQSIKWI